MLLSFGQFHDPKHEKKKNKQTNKQTNKTRIKSTFKQVQRYRSIGPLHDPVTWYKITYTGEQVAQ